MCQYNNQARESAGTGRQARLRGVCRLACGFKSHLSHQKHLRSSDLGCFFAPVIRNCRKTCCQILSCRNDLHPFLGSVRIRLTNRILCGLPFLIATPTRSKWLFFVILFFGYFHIGSPPLRCGVIAVERTPHRLRQHGAGAPGLYI